MAATDPLGFADIVFTTAGDTATLMWTGTTGWAILSQHPAVSDIGLVDISNG